MNWYYAQNNQQLGPVDDDGFNRLIASGDIRNETLVWCESMSQWATLGQIRQGEMQDGQGAAWGFCSECGRRYTRQNLIDIEEVLICPQCKGVFFQQIIEGARSFSLVEYGGFWLRVGAKMLDGMIIGMAQMIIMIPLGLLVSMGAPDTGIWVSMASSLGQMLLDAVYRIFMVGKYGATLGKMACSLKVVTSDGGRVSYARATGRYFAEYLSMMTMMIGYIMAAFDDEKRTLHDHICNTRVVKKETKSG